jgi:hypothetical protein
MRRSLGLAFLIVCLIPLVSPTSASAIVGGQLDGNRHPGVGLLIGYDENGESFFACSGTLVSPTVFVTAAHCLGGSTLIQPADVTVTFGSQIPLDSEGVPTPAVEIDGEAYPNPAYHDDDLFSTYAETSEDYGVVVLEEPATAVFPDVVTYDLPTEGFLERKLNKHTFTLVGYGLSATSKHFKDTGFDGFRRYATMNGKGASLRPPSALELNANPNGSQSEQGTGCSGDSGGAVLDGSVLVAVISAGNGCISKSYSARLDVQPAIDFLAQFLHL